MKRPPCWDEINDTDCPRRYVGCKAECEDWHKWLAIHAEEKDRERKNRANAHDVDIFLCEQNKRVQQARHREYMRERNDFGKGNERG